MQRREFLAGTATAGVISMAGCAGVTEPQMEFQQFVEPNPTMVTVGVDDDEHFATIQNQGDSGNIRVELWYMRDSSTPDPPAPSMYLNNTRADQYFDVARSFFFDAGERREESIFASSDAPSVSEFPEYHMTLWSRSYGAVFENSGGTGEVEFRFEYRDTGGYNPAKPANKLDTVRSDSTTEVIFDTVVPPSAEYQILAEPM